MSAGRRARAAARAAAALAGGASAQRRMRRPAAAAPSGGELERACRRRLRPRECDASAATIPASDAGDASGAVDRERKGETVAGTVEAARGREQRARAGTLYVVATPLGNLRDVTLRAIDVLATRRRRIAAEDTRVTATLLRALRRSRRVRSPLHAHNEAARAAEIVAALAGGASVALVSDAGTPGDQRPGRAPRARGRATRAIRSCRSPGRRRSPPRCRPRGSTPTRFVFAGSCPRRRRRAASSLASLAGAADGARALRGAASRARDRRRRSPRRSARTRTLVVARELTKTFETIARLPLGDAPAWFAADANRERGEFVLIVDAPPARVAGADIPADALSWLDALAQELPPARAAKIVAERTGAPRDALYARALARRKDADA